MTAIDEKLLKRGMNGNSVRENEIVYLQFRGERGIDVYRMSLDKDGHDQGMKYTGVTLDGFVKPSKIAEIVRNSGKN